MSLARAFKEHQANQVHHRQRIDQLRKEAHQSVRTSSATIAKSLNAEIAVAFDNQRDIEQVLREVHQEVALFRQNTSEWLKLLDQFQNALKELGDVQAWSEAMVDEVNALCQVLEPQPTLSTSMQVASNIPETNEDTAQE